MPLGPLGDILISTRSGPGDAVNTIRPVVSGHIPIFADITGNVLEDSGLPASSFGGGVYGTATAIAGAATLNANRGRITSEALATGPGSSYLLTLTDNLIGAQSIVSASVDNGTNNTDGLVVSRVSSSVGLVTIEIINMNFTAALNGTIVIAFQVTG